MLFPGWCEVASTEWWSNSQATIVSIEMLVQLSNFTEGANQRDTSKGLENTVLVVSTILHLSKSLVTSGKN